MRISLAREKTEAIKAVWTITGLRTDDAPKQGTSSASGKLWNLTYVVRAGRYFVWRLLRLTGLHDERNPRNQHSGRLGRELHADLLVLKWATNRKLLQIGEATSAPCYTALKRPAKRHYLSDASFQAVGGYCVEKKVF